MRFCNQITHSIKNECDTHIGGIRRMYLINASDYIGADETTIYLTTGSSAFEIDAAKNTASLVQTAVTNSIGQTHIQSILTFSINKNAVNLLPQQMNLTLGWFKVLVEYWDRTWLLVDGSEDIFFTPTSTVRNTGIAENNFNGFTFTYTMRSFDYGIDYSSMPDVVTDGSTDPEWVLINEYCETV